MDKPGHWAVWLDWLHDSWPRRNRLTLSTRLASLAINKIAK
jgi:hypothetical protein